MRVQEGVVSRLARVHSLQWIRVLPKGSWLQTPLKSFSFVVDRKFNDLRADRSDWNENLAVQ